LQQQQQRQQQQQGGDGGEGYQPQAPQPQRGSGGGGGGAQPYRGPQTWQPGGGLQQGGAKAPAPAFKPGGIRVLGDSGPGFTLVV
jgi:hypothetical protein